MTLGASSRLIARPVCRSLEIFAWMNPNGALDPGVIRDAAHHCGDLVVAGTTGPGTKT